MEEQQLDYILVGLNARVYSVKVGGLEGSGDTGGISINSCFDVIKGWHENKLLIQYWIQKTQQ